MKWFTADEHLFHKNIMRYCNRSYRNVDEMNKDIIKNVNDTLRSGDTLYHIGDWCWGRPERNHHFYKIMKKYRNDITHILILGNHDNLKPFTYVDIGFQSVHTSLSFNFNGQRYILCHDPSVYTMIKDDDFLLCGHVHTLFTKLDNRAINVGVDVWNFKPISIDYINKYRKETT